MIKELSLDELMGKLQGWPDVFKQRFNRRIKKTEMLKYLEALYQKKMNQELSVFDSYGPQTLKIVIEKLKTEKFDNIEDDLETSQKYNYPEIEKAIPKASNLKDLVKNKKWLK